MRHVRDDHGAGMSRRELLARAGGLAALAAAPGLACAAGPGDAPGAGTAIGASSPPPAGAAQDAFPRKSDFTIPDGVTYINGAYMHPMPNVVRDAVREYNDRRAGFTTQTSDDPDISGTVKAAFAGLINADPAEIAFVPNTSTGEVLIVRALGIPGSGGNVVTDALHFEGAIVNLLELQRRTGLDVRIVMPRDGRIELDDIARVIDDETRLVELSWVAMYNGFQHDLKAVCDIAHAQGAYVYADVIQAVGAVPLDVRETGVDFCSCGGFKWLMGDLGCGFLYARRELLGDVVTRAQVGYVSLSEYQTHFLRYDPPGETPFTWALGDTATAYFEAGSAAGSARAALSASLPYVRSLGVERIQAHRQPILERLREELPRFGLECVTPPGTTSPIITFATQEADDIRRRFARAGVDVRVAENWVRFSPSIYNDLADVDRVVQALA